ncbi:hypothetical protein DL93DRAFT_2073584 [Clavulina sp. PMI_390]|nr:hypothetical protein DL93DRAFT_2073584 [Clavulina sp. PMI_390]
MGILGHALRRDSNSQMAGSGDAKFVSIHLFHSRASDATLYLPSSNPEPTSTRTKLITATAAVIGSFFFYPIQLLYAVVLLRQLWRCSDTEDQTSSSPADASDNSRERTLKWRMVSPTSSVAVGYVSRSPLSFVSVPSSDLCHHSLQRGTMSLVAAQRRHFLLLLAVLFPFLGPALFVWIRTLMTAGLLAPFHDDHGIRTLGFILVLTELTAEGPIASPAPKSRLDAFF